MRTPLASLVLCCALPALSAASPDAFSALSAQLDAVRAAAQAQKLMPQHPKAMGGGHTGEAPVMVATPNVSAYPVRGIDISHYDGTVDWGAVAKDGLSFVYIKATEGTNLGDAQFSANWKGAAGAGLLRGAYHFYDFCSGGAAQADNFIKTVPTGTGTLPPTIDLEQSADCKNMPAKAAFRVQLAAFVKKVQAAYGAAPILYVNGGIYATYFQGENDPYKLWIADVSDAAPQIPGNPAWALWQYGWNGAVAGVSDGVDLDVFNGTPQMLASLADGSPGLEVADLR